MIVVDASAILEIVLNTPAAPRIAKRLFAPRQEVALAELQKRFTDPAVLRDPNALSELKEKVDYATGDLAVVEAAWHERVDLM